MTKLISTLFAFFFILHTFSQNTSDISIGSKSIIPALDYTNDINKYYFDEIKMNEIASFLLANSAISIEVNCHTDFVDNPLMNLMATAEQANDIRNYLVNKGIAGTRIKTVGNGNLFPIVESSFWHEMDEAEKKIANNLNRRIEIVIFKIDTE